MSGSDQTHLGPAGAEYRISRLTGEPPSKSSLDGRISAFRVILVRLHVALPEDHQYFLCSCDETTTQKRAADGKTPSTTMLLARASGGKARKFTRNKRCLYGIRLKRRHEVTAATRR